MAATLKHAPPRLALASFAAAVALSLGLYRVRTFDTFFHLAAGRYIVEHNTIPVVDTFSFTFPSAPWHNHSAGFQVFLYALERVGGIAGISVWQGISALLLAVLSVSSVRRIDGVSTVALPLVLVPMLGLREVLEARPHVMGFLCFAGTVVICQRTLRDGRALRLFAVLPIAAAWQSAHGSHLMAWPTLSLGALVALLHGRRALAGAQILILVAVVLTSLVLAPDALALGGSHMQSSFLEGSVQEWYPLTFSEVIGHASSASVVLIGALSVFGLVALARARDQLSIEERCELAFQGCLLAALVVLGCTSRRMFAFFALAGGCVWLPFASHAVCCLFDRGPRADILLRLGCTLALAIQALSSICWPGSVVPGAGLMSGRFPEEALTLLKQSTGFTRLYNAYNFGGYLMWMRPEAPVFVDGRAITVYPTEFLDAFERAYRDMPLFEALVRRYDVDGVLLPTQSERTKTLRAYLAKSAAWTLRHEDAVAILYQASTEVVPPPAP